MSGDQGLRAISVPTQSQASSTFRKVAFYVKLVRVPFLIVAIYGLGYRQGITDTVRNPLKLQQVSFVLCAQQNVVLLAVELSYISSCGVILGHI